MDIKLVIVGGGGVGKSAMTIQFVQNQFVEEYDPTIEDMYRKQVLVDGTCHLVEILDTAGQEEYKSMRDGYMLSGEGFVLVYSITSKNSFEELPELVEHILRVKDKDSGSVPMVIAGNKCDIDMFREVSRFQGEELAKANHTGFFETSAKVNVNVVETFHECVRRIQAPKMKREHDKE